MKTISLLDTTISSYNLGNEIIMEAVNSAIEELFPESFLFRIPCEENFSVKSLRYMANSDYTFFGGTNSFSSHLLKYKQHGFRLRDLMLFRNLISLGMGWWQYQTKPGLYSTFFWKTLLSDSCLHSVRDEYTKTMLASIGIKNALNTSCPTTWMLSEEHCAVIPSTKSDHVVTTLTDYSPSLDEDKKMLEILFGSYKSVSIWLQGQKDMLRFRPLFQIFPDIQFIPPKLSLYDRFLLEHNCDYIGTRLHGGIRALQKKRRSLIISIDNRAKEISNDINLNVCARGDLEAISRFANSNAETNLKLPAENIQLWKKQFC